MASSSRSAAVASQRLARMALVLAPERRAGARVRAVAIGMAALVVAAASGWYAGANGVARGLVPHAAATPTGLAEPASTRTPAAPAPDDAPAAPALVQARAALQLAEARGQELERQIDALNHRLHQCQEELTFFRKASGKRAP